MGKMCPPLYGVSSIEEDIKKIKSINETISNLIIESDLYANSIKEKLEKIENIEDTD